MKNWTNNIFNIPLKTRLALYKLGKYTSDQKYNYQFVINYYKGVN